jgi:hypothetical protein
MPRVLLLFHVDSRMTGARTGEDLLCRVVVARDGEDSSCGCSVQ